MAKEKTVPKTEEKTAPKTNQEAEEIRKKMQEKADDGCPFC
jgi:hypothetical protein